MVVKKMIMKSKMFLAIFLIIELIATPVAVEAGTIKTHIEIEDNSVYDPITNTFYTGKNWIGNEYNLIVRLRDNHGNNIKGETLKITLSEIPGTDMNNNDISGEKLVVSNNYSDSEKHEVSIAEWFRDKYPHLPEGRYHVLVKFYGNSGRGIGSSDQLINLYYYN